MTQVVQTLAFILCGCGAVLFAAVLWRLFKEGPAETRRLRRQGFGMGALMRGEMEKPENGSTIHMIEGLECLAEGDRIKSVRQTRTFSREVA